MLRTSAKRLPSLYARRALALSFSLLIGWIVLPLLIAVTLLQRSKTDMIWHKLIIGGEAEAISLASDAGRVAA